MHYPIVPMPPDLWPAVREIYREGIATGNATFETEVPDWEKWIAAIERTAGWWCWSLGMKASPRF